MKKSVKYRIRKKYEESRGKLIIAVSAVFAGVILGAVWAYTQRAEQLPSYFSDFISSFKLLGTDAGEIFSRAFWGNLRAVLFIWISGWAVFLIPVGYIELAAKGFGLGYTISFFVIQNGAKGFFFALVALLPQNIIFIPSLIIYSAIQLRFSFSFNSVRRAASLFKQRRNLIANNLLCLLCMVSICALCALTDSYFTPLLLNLFQ